MNFINENMYSHGRSAISDLLNRPLNELLGFTLAMILTVSSCNMNTFLLAEELLPKNYSILYNKMKTGKFNWFESVSVADI
jgi:hypothetical protein